MVRSEDIHPMRWTRTRPFAREVIQILRREPRQGSAIGSDAFREVTLRLVAAYNNGIARLPIAERPHTPTNAIRDETTLANLVGAFARAGRNIFALGPNLAGLLDRPDLDGVRAGDLRMPFPAFHIAFPDTFDARLPGPPNRIDGAHIAESGLGDGVVDVAVTSHRLDVPAGSAAGWPVARDAFFHVRLDLSDPARDFGAILDAAVRDGQVRAEPEPGAAGCGV